MATSSVTRACVAVLPVLLLLAVKASAQSVTAGSTETAKDSTTPANSWYTLPDSTEIPGLNGVVKYAFTLNNTGGTQVASTSEIHVTIGGTTPAFTANSLSCLRADNTVLAVNEGSSGTTQIGTVFAAGATATCTFKATVSTAARQAGAMPAYTVDVSVKPSGGSSTAFGTTFTHSVVKVYTGSSMTSVAAVKTADVTANKYVTVNSTQVPKTGASYTYTITLANGAKAVPSGSYLKVAVATVTASTPSCTISSTALSGTNHDQLSADLAATSGTVACTFDVNVTSYVSAGAVPAFDVTASWVTASGGTTLVDTAFFIPKITTAAQPVYTGNALGVPTAAVPADSTKYVTVGGSHVASVTGTVRYTITLTNGAKNIPTNSQLTLTTSGVTPAATNCKAAIGGVNTTIPTAQAISNATMLASTLVITCDLDVTVTAAHKIAGTIASFTVSAAYSGASLTGTDIQAMYIPAVTTPAVPVYTGNILAVTAQQVVTTDPSKYINVNGVNWARQYGIVRYTVTLTNGAKNIPSPAVLDFSAAGVTLTNKTCVTGATAIPTGVNITDATKLVAGLVVTCTLDLNVTTDQKTAGSIPALDITASYTGTSFAATDALALGVPAATTAAVNVFQESQTWLVSRAVTSTDTSKYGTVGTDKFPKLGAQVTYTVILINGGTPIYANETFNIAVTTSPANDVAYPSTITSCKTGTAVTNLPGAPLAANTALVCSFVVTVTTDHVKAQTLPSITVQAQKGITALPGTGSAASLAIYTDPSLTLSYTLATGDAGPLDLGANVKLATQGTDIIYTATFTNGYVAVPAGTAFTLAVTGLTPTTALTYSPSNTATAGIASNGVVTVTFKYRVTSTDKGNAYSPDIRVDAQLTTGADTKTVVSATSTRITVFKAGPAVYVQNAATSGSSVVDTMTLANVGGVITYTVVLVNGAVAVGSADALSIAVKSTDAAFPTAVNTTCTPALPLADGTTLAAAATVTCTFNVTVTAAHLAATLPGVPAFDVVAYTGTTNIASAHVQLTHVNSPATVRYSMAISGPIAINGTNMAKNSSSIEYTVTLINGPTAKPSTNEYSLITNSSTFSTFTSCSNLANNQSYTSAKVNGLAAFEGIRCKTQRVVSADDIAAGTFAPFAIQALEKDTNSYAPTAVSYVSDVNVPALELFTGLPCKACQKCLAQVFGFIQQYNLLVETDAGRIATLFNTNCRTNRATNKCSAVMNATLSSVNGNVGKRAGLICTMLGECEPQRFEATCDLGSASPPILDGDIDLCKPEGTKPSESTIPGVAAAGINITTAMQGYCYNSTNGYCPAGQECAKDQPGVTALKRCFCGNTTGLDTCEDYYPCVDTPCTQCTKCMSVMRAFANQATIQNEVIPQKVADAFKSQCFGAGVDAATCIGIAVKIADSYQGSLGKRPAWLCKQVGGCPSNITTLPADCVITGNRTGSEANLTRDDFAQGGLCTVDGWATGAVVPGIYPNSTKPSWACTTDSSCNATTNEVCSTAANKQFCTCDPATGVDSCSDIGQCVAISCATCNSCLQKTGAWISSRTTVTSASALATAWSSHCSGTLGITATGLCDSVKNAILSSYNGNIAKRAGNLCSRLNLCSGVATTCNPLNTTSTNLTVTTPYTGFLDMCTMEGIAGANYIPGVFMDTIPTTDFVGYFPNKTYKCTFKNPGSCLSDYQCDITTVAGAVCRCETADAGTVPAGSDTCTEYYNCVRTPCKVCSDCLADMTGFALGNLYTLDPPTLGDAFNATCAAKGYPSATCSAVAAKIKNNQSSIAFGKRAGALCSAMAVCNKDDLEADITCTLKPNTTYSGNATLLDNCTVQGLNTGDLPPGTNTDPTAMPLGRCDNEGDCALQKGNSNWMCSKIPGITAAPFCTCYKGQDTCRDLGTCIKKPCPACQDCMGDFQAFVTAASAVSSAAELVTAFATNCTSTGRTKVCDAAALAIATSYKGNAGRKASSICRLLGECNATAMGTCNMTVAGKVGRYSMCTKQGLDNGDALPGSPINTTYTLGTNQCATSSDCDTTSGYECRMPLPGQDLTSVCYCDASTGRDMCTPVGTCQLTACQVCQNCLDAANPIITAQLNTSSPSKVAACNAAATPATAAADCTNLVKYFTESATSTGLFGLRAAAVCSGLKKCTQASCQLRAAVAGVNKTAAIDLCTAEGIVGGTQIAQGKPDGACLTDAECSTDMQCDKSNTTNKVNKCFGGMDTITQYGACVAKPPSRANLPACTRCSQCITALRPSAEAAALNLTATRTYLGAAFYAACSGAQYSLTACRDVQALVESSVAGNLARRVGALCVRLGECSSALSTDSSCTLTANATTAAVQVLVQPVAVVVSNDTNTTVTANTTVSVDSTVTVISGKLDTCTIEGVSSGGMVLGTFKYGQAFNNTCVLDSDCANGLFCSSSSTIKVCRCLNGIDSCDVLSTCKAPAVVAPVVVKTPCQRCGDCLTNVASFVTRVAGLASPDSKVEAATFMGLCTTNYTANNVMACKPVADAIFYDIRVAKKGGLICQRLGECSGDLAAAASTCNMTVGAKSGKLNLCEKEGVGISANVTAATFNSTNCRTDADCKNGTTYIGQVCSFNAANVKLASTCSNGVDTITKTGTCVGFCSTQASSIADLNAKIDAVKCSDPYADCGLGMSCKSNALCNRLVCSDDVKGVTTAQCFGFCVAADRTVLSAKMSNEGQTITAALNTAAAPGAFPCAAVFDGPTMEKLGYEARCEANGKELRITLGPQSTFNPDVNTLTVSSTQKALVDILDATAKFIGSAIAVAKCAAGECTGATAIVFGPQFVPEPCDASTAADVIFDASFSNDQSGRPLSKVVWELTTGGPDVVVQAAVDKANSANNGDGAYRMVIPGSQITNMVGTSYMVTVTVSNFLGAVSSATWSFTKKGLGITPVVTLPSGNAVSFKIADGVKVPLALAATSVCSDKKVEYSWTPATAWDAIPAGYSKKDLVIPGPVAGIAAGQSINVTVTAKFTGATAADATTAVVTLTALASPLRANLKGPQGDVKSDRDIVLSAAGSRDPDDPQATKPLAVSWDCVRADFPAPCFTGAAAGTKDGLTWTIPAGLLATDVQHTIVANVSRTYANGTVNNDAADQAQVSLTPRGGAIPTGRIRRVCSGPCPPNHSADSALIVTLAADAGSEAATVAWSSEQIPTAGTVTGKDWVIPASQLPKTGAVNIKAVLAAGSASSTTTTLVPINGKPVCTKDGGCIAVDVATGVFPTAQFTAQADGFVDDQPGLRFDFGTLGAYDTHVVVASGPTPTYTFTGLPVGVSGLCVCAVDMDGASTCSTTKVTVTAPAAADFKVADALTGFDVDHLVGTGDMTVLAAGAQALQSLSKFASNSNVAATQTAEEQDQVQKTIAAKTSSMIGTLASKSSDYINDPQTMSQVVSAVATLSKATTQLSKDTKDKMLDVANSGITSAKLSQKPVSPAEASRLWAVVAAGNDLKATCKVPGSCAQAANVARRLLQELPEWLNVDTVFSRSLLESAAVTAPITSGRHLLANETTTSTANDTVVAVADGNATTTTTTPATTTTESFVPSFAAQANQVADLLAQGAGPAAYKSGGDNGLHISTANFLGRNYKSWSVAAGPALDASGNQADSTSGENAQLKFSKQLVATCVDEEGTVLGSGTCGDVVVPVRFTYLPDAASLLAATTTSARKLQAVDGHTIVSGAAVVDVAGDSKSAFPCDGCTATVTIPIYEQKQDWMLYDCGRIVDGVVTYDATDATSAGVQSVNTPAVPTVTCTVNKGGSYIIGKRADPNRPAGTPETDPSVEALVLGQPLMFNFKLEIDEATFGSIDDFLKDATRVNTFVQSVKSELVTSFTANSLGAGITKDSIQVLNVHKGSIDFDVIIDTSAITDAAALKALATYIKSASSPSALFSSSFISTYSVTGMTVTMTQYTAPAPVLPLAAIIGGVVGGVGGAILVAAIAFFIIRRRKMGGVEPRGTANRNLLNGDHSA